MKISDLKLNPKNPQKFKDLSKLEKSIKEFPKMMELRPMVYDPETMFVLGGNKRLICLQKLGFKEIPDTWVRSAAELTEEEKKRFIIADNVGFGEWDWELLKEDYTIEELDGIGLKIPSYALENEEAKEDDFEMPERIKTQIKEGDIIEIGPHRLFCGDATKKEQVEVLMRKEKADLIITDPPYNLDYVGKTKKALTISNDSMADDDFFSFLLNAFKAIFEFIKNGGAIYIWHADSEGYNFRRAMKMAGFLLKQNLIWVKNTMVMGRHDYQWRHEACLYGWKPNGSHYFADYRNKTTVIDDKVDYKKMKKDELLKIIENLTGEKTPNTVIYHDKPNRNAEHPTMKPILLLADLIINSSKPRELILDTFLGSGSTMVAAHQLNRRCYGMELDPKYCQVIIDRMHKLDPELKIKINGKIYKP